MTINEIHNVYESPKSLKNQWPAPSYHGSEMHNSRAVINRYLGYWDGNPTTLIPLSPSDSAPLYVEMMGGVDAILVKGRELHDAGRYRLAQEIVNKLVYTEPDNVEAKHLLADIFEQIGYQMESPSVRNSFLSAALELRSGSPEGTPPQTASANVLGALTTEMFFDYLAIQLDSTKVEDVAFTVNVEHPDVGEQYVIELSNATLTTQAGFKLPNPDISVRVDPSDFVRVILGENSLPELAASGAALVEGDLTPLMTMLGALATFDLLFEMMPGAAPKKQQPPSTIAGPRDRTPCSPSCWLAFRAVARP